MDNYVGDLPAILDLEYNNLHSYVSNKDSSEASPWCINKNHGIIERTNIEFQFIQ